MERETDSLEIPWGERETERFLKDSLERKKQIPWRFLRGSVETPQGFLTVACSLQWHNLVSRSRNWVDPNRKVVISYSRAGLCSPWSFVRTSGGSSSAPPPLKRRGAPLVAGHASPEKKYHNRKRNTQPPRHNVYYPGRSRGTVNYYVDRD